MSRCRFVQPDPVRLYFVDVHRLAHQELVAKRPERSVTKDEKAAYDVAVTSEFAKIAEAEADPHFIDIKRELTAGEQRRMFSGMMRDLSPGEKLTLNPELIGRTKVSAYLIGWSLTDFDGKPVPVSDSAIDNLDTDTYAEIVQAIDYHETHEAERKNAQAGASRSNQISPSVAP